MLEQEELDEIRRILTPGEAVDRTYEVELRSVDGVVHAEVEKVVHVQQRPATR